MKSCETHKDSVVLFKRVHGAKDYFGLRGKFIKMLLLGTIIVGQVTLSLWAKRENLVGAQRQTTYVEQIEKGKKYLPEVLAVNVYFTSTGSYGRDAYLPGWNPAANTVDCIGGGGGGGGAHTSGYGAGGGGGGGLARYNNLGALPATLSITVGAGGPAGGANANGTAGGNTDFHSYVGAYGGGAGICNGGGGAGGTYYAGQGSYSGGAGGAGNVSPYYGGGGGGAAGRYGGGGTGEAGINPTPVYGGNGGPSGGGAGGASSGAAGGTGQEYTTNVGSGGGGGGAYSAVAGGPGGYYGGGGGGGYYFSGARPGGAGASGLIAAIYTPLTAPVVSTCTPNTGPVAGGTAITIGGSGFINVVSVTVGGVAATSVVVGSASSITCVTGAHALGTVDIVVNVSGGVASGTGTNLFTYLPASGGFNMPMMGIT